jgi:hypothetical protein
VEHERAVLRLETLHYLDRLLCNFDSVDHVPAPRKTTLPAQDETRAGMLDSSTNQKKPSALVE